MAPKKQSVPMPGREVPQVAVPRDAAPEANHPIDTAVDAFFKNDERVRAAMSRNLKERGAATLEVAGRAKAAFENFSPSKYSPEERAQRNFVPVDESPALTTRAVVDKGVAAIRASAPQRAMKIHLGGGLDKMIEKDRGGGSMGQVALGDLVGYVEAKIRSSPLNAPSGPAFTDCRAELEAQRRLDEVLDDNKDEDSELDTTPSSTETNGTKELRASELVSQQVQTQMKTATSPEGKLLFAVPSRSDPRQTDKAIETFELRAGPADVTSYHDFNNLQIAFEHVWEEFFDGRLAKLGQNLYHEYVKLQELVGVTPEGRSIDTIDDLKNLMAEIRELAKLTNDVTPAPLQHKGESGSTNSGGDTTDAVVDIVQTVLDPAGVITDAIGDETVSAILNPAGAIIDAIADLIKGTPEIRWSSFPGPLPGNGDLISVQIQENVAPVGVVEIELQTGPNTRGWKAIAFMEFDENLKVKSAFNISNDPNDANVWDRTSYSLLPLYTPQVTNTMLESHHEGMFGVHTRCFILAALAEKLEDRSRVTFTWLKDR